MGTTGVDVRAPWPAHPPRCEPRSVRSTIIASLLIALALGALAGCGQSKAEKAQDKVCEASDDIGKQVEALSELTLTTATRDQVTGSLQTIQSDLKTIADATGDLAEDKRKDVHAANDAFKAKMAQIGASLGSSLSIENALAQGKAALKELANSYKSTFGQLDCS